MSEELDVLAIVVTRVEAAGIEYMITGAFALAVYATPRMTRDIDVLIDCTSDQAAQLATSFQADSYASEDAAREAVATGTMFNVIHNSTLMKVDFMVRQPGVYTDEQFARRRRVDVAGLSVPFISPEDLVLAKLLWRRDTGSEQQLRDVQAVVAAVSKLDWEYLATWAGRLGLARELDQVKAT
jgi:hypothetical protein